MDLTVRLGKGITFTGPIEWLRRIQGMPPEAIEQAIAEKEAMIEREMMWHFVDPAKRVVVDRARLDRLCVLTQAAIPLSECGVTATLPGVLDAFLVAVAAIEPEDW